MSVEIICDICGSKVDEDEFPYFVYQPADGESLLISLNVSYKQDKGHRQPPDICGECQKEFLKDFAFSWANKEKS
jgi:hypothetical protein